MAEENMQGFIAEVGRILQTKYGKSKTFADIAVAQMNLESAYGTSRLIRENYNAGGLTQVTPNGEENKQPDGDLYYRIFKNPEDYADALVNDFFNHYPEIYNAQTPTEFAQIAHANGYFHDDLNKYIGLINNAYGSDWENTNYYGGVNPLYVMQDAPVSQYGEEGYLDRNSDWQNIARGNRTGLGGWTQEFSDSFMSSWTSNSLIGVARNALYADNVKPLGTPKEDLSNLDDYTLKQALANIGLSENDYKAKQGSRYEAFENLKAQAFDREQLVALAKLKGEDLDREERIESRGTTAMGISGTVAGMLLDPINLVPILGQEAIGLKLAGKLGGKLTAKLATSKGAQLAEIGLTNGLINLSDTHLSNKANFSTNDNYVASFLMGAGAGAGLSFLQRKLSAMPKGEPKGKHELAFEDEVDKMAKSATTNGAEVKPAKRPKAKPVEEPLIKPPEETKPPTVEPMSGLQRVDDDLVAPVTASITSKADMVDKRLIDELNSRYGLKLSDDLSADGLMRHLFNTPEGIYFKPPKLVKLMDAYGLNTVEDMANHALAYNKHAKTGAIKEFFEGIVGGKLSDGQFRDIARHIKAGGTFDNLEVKLSDGSVFFNGAHHSPDSLVTKALDDDAMFLSPEESAKRMLNEEPTVKPKEEPEFDDVFADEKQGRAEYNKGNIANEDKLLNEQQLTGNKVAQVTGRALEQNKFIGNRYGVFINSLSKTMQKVARVMGIDPRLRARNNVSTPPVSMMKQLFMNKYSKPQAEYMDAFRKWSIETGKIPPTDNSRRRFNEEVNKVYDSLYNPYNADMYTSDSKAINQAVQAVRNFRELDLKLHKINGTLPSDFQGAGELWRRVDYDKQTLLRTEFDSDKEFSAFMREVASQSIDWDKMTPEFKTNYLSQLEISDVEAQALMRRQGLGFKVGEAFSGQPNGFKDMDELKKYVVNNIIANDDGIFKDVVAGHWAEQVTRRQDDILSDIHIGSDRMGYYQARIPMDTTKAFTLPSGKMFTFNDSLRNQDLSSIMAYVANRSSGTMALRRVGIENPVTDLKKIYERIEGELTEAVKQRKISSKQMTRELDEVKDVFHNVSGGALIFPEVIRPQTFVDRLKNIILTESYRQNGMNFGVNQLAETIGGISVVGARALTHFVPALHDFIHNLKYSKDFSAKQLRNFKDYHLGHSLAEHIWFNPQMKRDAFQLQAENTGVGMKLMGGIESAVDFGAKITSTINQISKMTQASTRGIQADVLPEMMMWARGEYNSVLRTNLFSERHLAEAGITDPDGFKKILRDRLMNLGDEEDALSKAVTKWQEEDMTSYSKLEMFLNLASGRAVLEPTLWNNAKRMDGMAGLVQGVMWQFKNFSQMALNSHLGRVLNNGEREDFNMLMSTAIANGMVWATSVYFNSYKYFGDDEEKRQAYMEKTLTPERLLSTGLLRSSLLSGMSFANDAYEMFAGGTSSRTTVDRMPESDNMMYNFITQFPAVQSAYRAFNGVASMPEAMANLMSNKEADFDPLLRLFPLDRYIPIKGALSIMADKADIEARKRKERKQRQELFNKKKLEKRKERNGTVQNESILDLLK